MNAKFGKSSSLLMQHGARGGVWSPAVCSHLRRGLFLSAAGSPRATDMPPPPSGSHPVPTHQETTVLGCPRAAVLLHGRAGLICSLLDLKRVFFWLKSEHWRWNMVETLSQSGRKIVSVCWTLGPGRLLQSLMYQGEHLGAGSRHVLLADSRLSRVCLICIRNDFIWYIQLFYLK